MLWGDEFDGPTGAPVDSSKWAFDLGGGGWGNKEVQTYTNDRNNVSIDGDGHLIIRAVRSESGEITSARLKTKDKFSFLYGKAEARIKIPRGQGMWPAFWMLGNDIDAVGWPKCGEIDVMENIGKEPAILHGTVHGPGYSGQNGISGHRRNSGDKPLGDDFHVYSIEWQPGLIRFSLDGDPYASVTPASLPSGAKWVYDHPFFLILNLAVGGGWPGNPDATSVFPQTMLVDWVRISQR